MAPNGRCLNGSGTGGGGGCTEGVGVFWREEGVGGQGENSVGSTLGVSGRVGTSPDGGCN